MNYKLFYLREESSGKKLYFDRDVDEKEVNLIKECNEILGAFNKFCDYYHLLQSSLNDLKLYLKKVEPFSYKIAGPIELKNVIIELNKLVIDFYEMFANYKEYYGVQIKHVFGNNSKEILDYDKRCQKYYDNFFEYRFLCNIRHYCVHYDLPITKMEQKISDGKRKFLIQVSELKKWKGWKSTIKGDIISLKDDIDISTFSSEIESFLKKFNNENSFYNVPELLGAIKILKRYLKKNENPSLVINDQDHPGNFIIRPILNDFIVANYNILNLGIISCMNYSKEYGLQIFDPFDFMFSKEEKDKYGLS